MNHSKTKITSNSNVIPYSQYVIESQQTTIQNYNFHAQQDALILSIIEQLKTQVVNCTKINLDNKSVNDTLAAELERYKEQVRILKEGQNVDLKNNDNISDSCAHSIEIDHLKQTLSEHLKEKESLMQTITLLKNDFKKEKSRNIDREISLEQRIKQLDNIVFKRAQGFQIPFYLKKAQQLEPKFYDGNVIEKTNAIVIHDTKKNLMLAEESCSKMLLKQKDPMMLEKKVNSTPIDYAVLNQLSQDFETRFVLQTELSTKQAFWSQNSMNSPEPTPSSRPTKVEVPKVSMVNTSLKKLKQHLASFDVVIKERTTATTIIEGTWGFEHTKACFRDEIVPFVKALKDLFNSFDQFLVDELSEVQHVFHQTEQAMEQHQVESKTFEVKMNKVLNENERLLEQVISKDIVNIIVNSFVNNAYETVHECERCLKLETELQKDFIKKEIYDKLFKSYTTLKKHCISLEVDTQLNQSQEKDMVIKKLKERIRSLSGNMKEDKIKKELGEIETINIKLDHRVTKLIAENKHLKRTYKQLYDSIKSSHNLRKLKGKAIVVDDVTSHPIDPEMLKVDVAPLDPKLKNNKTAHSDYIRHTQEQTAILKEIVKQETSLNPLNNSLDYVFNLQPQQAKFPQLDSGLTVPVFKQGDDPIDAINHMMQQATINDGRVTLQLVHGRQVSFATDPRIAKGQATQIVITHNAAYQANDLDAHDSDCDELNNAKVTLIANLSYYGSDVLAELELNLYDGNVIMNTYAIMIPDSEETLMLAKKSHSKMILKQQDLMVLEKKVNTTPVDYAALNQLS
uniref:Integrase, catalytic region, zinc finger, CCHC-type, peptidase aspartic, catalytic n=1 Tax=Tanacetum cinerariifolium TaxID=118510 RepID=A0A6L2JCY3_TANCI|nr:hypothetical protein [Tanacetum cinerariifolium]